MSENTCPKCGINIASDNFMYCYKCGSKLFSDPDEPSFEQPAQPIDPIFRNKKILLALSGFFLIVSLATLGFVVYNRSPNRKPQTPSNIAGEASVSAEIKPNDTKEGVVVRGVYFPMSSEKLDFNLFADKVPAEVDFYWESTHPEKLILDKWGIKFAKAFKEKTNLSLEEAASFLEVRYALLGQGASGWCFLAKIKDMSFVTEKLSTLSSDSFPGVEFLTLNGTLIISNSSSLVEEVKSTLSAQMLKLSEKKEFAEAYQKLPDSGQAFFWLDKDFGLGFLKQVLPGTYLVFAEALSVLDGKAFVIDRVKEGTEVFYR